LDLKLKSLEQQLQELKEVRSRLEERNKDLIVLIKESEFRILEQKKEVTQAYLNAFSEEEEKACKKLIKMHEA
jgi:hypothetical protein